MGVIKGDTRSLDYSSFRVWGEFREVPVFRDGGCSKDSVS